MKGNRKEIDKQTPFLHAAKKEEKCYFVFFLEQFFFVAFNYFFMWEKWVFRLNFKTLGLTAHIPPV